MRAIRCGRVEDTRQSRSETQPVALQNRQGGSRAFDLILTARYSRLSIAGRPAQYGSSSGDHLSENVRSMRNAKSVDWRVVGVAV